MNINETYCDYCNTQIRGPQPIEISINIKVEGEEKTITDLCKRCAFKISSEVGFFRDLPELYRKHKKIAEARFER